MVINEYLQALNFRYPELKKKVFEDRFWKQLLFDHLNWKYKDSDACHKAIYEFMGLEIEGEWIVVFYFRTMGADPNVLKYPDNGKGWKYTTRDKTFRFASEESAQEFIEGLDPIHKPIARIEKA